MMMRCDDQWSREKSNIRWVNGDHEIGMKFLTRLSRIARDSIPIWLSTKRKRRCCDDDFLEFSLLQNSLERKSSLLMFILWRWRALACTSDKVMTSPVKWIVVVGESCPPELQLVVVIGNTFRFRCVQADSTIWLSAMNSVSVCNMCSLQYKCKK